MDEVIEEAVQKTKKKRQSEGKRDKDEEPPLKKKKTKHSVVDETPILTKDEQNKINIARRELKALFLKYPDLDITRTVEVDEHVESLPMSEVKKMLENMKVAIGQQNPSSNSETILGPLALILQKVTGKKRIYRDIMDDTKLHAAFEQMLPCIEDYISVPLQIAHRLGNHLANSVYDEQDEIL